MLYFFSDKEPAQEQNLITPPDQPEAQPGPSQQPAQPVVTVTMPGNGDHMKDDDSVVLSVL
jgi:hypothetical protein